MSPQERAEMRASAQQKSEKAIARASQELDALSPDERAARLDAARSRMFALPDGVPALEFELRRPCDHLTPDGRLDGCVFVVNAGGVGCYSRAGAGWITLFERPWTHIRSLEVEAPNVAERRATAPRIIALGAVGLAFKKRIRRAYLIVTTIGGDQEFFEMSDVEPIELRAEVSPVDAWLRRHFSV